MQKHLPALLLFLIPLLIPAQTELKLSRVGPTHPRMLALQTPKAEIRENDSLNEDLVDLVYVYLTDSTFERKKQRHKAAGLGVLFAPVAGIKWQALYNRKEKFVGTASNKLHAPGEELFTEYDVNWNLHAHTRKYMDLTYYGYAEQKNIGKFAKKHNNYEGAPWEYPEDGADMKRYRMHCENTPPVEFREAINAAVYPCLPEQGKPYLEYFGQEYPSVGLYGVYCLDCNHSCYPEIHPYEWVWWLNLHPDMDAQPNQRKWTVALVREGSNRMKKWSPNPRSGRASIPFVFPMDQTLNIRVKHLAHSEFDPEGFATLKDVPENATPFSDTMFEYKMNVDEPTEVLIHLESDVPMNTEALKFALSYLNYDPERRLVSGFFEVWTSVEWLYAIEVEFDN